MRNDVHTAALKAAAKVAFSMAFVSGCSSSAGEPTGESESAVMTYGSPSKPDAAVSCTDVLAATFPKPGDYQWEPVPQSAEVVSCCKEELEAHDASTPYRWDCCVAFDPKTGDTTGHAMACTPWGPPVPPAMKARTLRAVA